MTMENIKVPPASLEAEMLVLGSGILDPAALATVRRILAPDDLFSPRHHVIYRAILELAGAGEPVELPALSARLAERGQLETAGGTEYLCLLVEGVPSTASVEHYAKIVADKAELRRAIAACLALVESAYRPDADVAGIVGALQASAYALTRRGDRRSVTVAEAINQAMDHAAQVERGEIPPGLATGFDGLDHALGGLKPGQLIVLAGETGGGKSTLGLNIAENVLAAGGGVLIVSAEMSAMQLGRRILASKARVPGRQIAQGTIGGEGDWQELHALAALAASWRGEIITGKSSPPEIVLRARELAAQWGKAPDLIVVDYLQLLAPTTGDNRAQQVSALAWELKMAAVDLACPVLLLSQLNRAGQGREAGGAKCRPELWGLKESGDIENHSDSVLLLYHPTGPGSEVTGWPVWLRIAKNRDGLTTPWDGPGAIRLRWSPSITRFESEPE